MNRLAITRDVADVLSAAEAAVETALERGVRLVRRLMEARRDLGLQIDAVEPALLRANAAVAALGEAQKEVLRARQALVDLKRELEFDRGPAA